MNCLQRTPFPSGTLARRITKRDRHARRSKTTLRLQFAVFRKREVVDAGTRQPDLARKRLPADALQPSDLCDPELGWPNLPAGPSIEQQSHDRSLVSERRRTAAGTSVGATRASRGCLQTQAPERAEGKAQPARTAAPPLSACSPAALSHALHVPSFYAMEETSKDTSISTCLLIAHTLALIGSGT